MSAPDPKQPRIVIIGGGFAGLNAARALARRKLAATLIDRRNHHLFQPLLYQVASAALNPADIAVPIRQIVPAKYIRVLMADVRGIDLNRNRIVLGDGEEPFDYLIVATGATHSYFGKDDWARVAPGLKTLEDALQIRRRILLAFERAEREPDPAARRRLMTFVIVGGGPTGVELAGALSEVARYTLARDFTRIDPTGARVLLVEGLPHVLPTYPEELSVKARASLEHLGVEVRTGQMVSALDACGVEIGEERIEAETVLWAAGVAASPLVKGLGMPLDRAGRLQVLPTLQTPGAPHVFVAGDLAALEQDGHPIPGVAPAAIQQGRHVAGNVERLIRGEAPLAFRYRDRGAFSVIGRGAAVGVAYRRLRMSGFPAWMAWLFIHLLFLVGFRNRLIVLINWSYSFFTLGRAARLITGEEGHPLPRCGPEEPVEPAPAEEAAPAPH